MSISAPFSVTCTDAKGLGQAVNWTVTIVRPAPTLVAISGTMTVNTSGSTQVATARGGTPPYYFVSDTFAKGAPPMGTVLDLQGNLTGMPTRTGVYDFGVRVVDSVGAENSEQTSVTVAPTPTPTATPRPTPTPGPTPAPVSAEIDLDIFPTEWGFAGFWSWNIQPWGTVSGPVGAVVTISARTSPDVGGMDIKVTKSSWTILEGGKYMRRDGASPESTKWSGSGSLRVTNTQMGLTPQIQLEVTVTLQDGTSGKELARKTTNAVLKKSY